MTNNQYSGITYYYDLWTNSGYYDYQSMARGAYSILGAGKQILELGVGTGSLVEKYLEIDPNCEFTGIDFTNSMLEIAEKRVGNKAKLIEADALTMNLQTTFDAAISNGGVWGVLGEENPGNQVNSYRFGGHIYGLESNYNGLMNLKKHLKPGGLLLLHIQKPHPNYDKELPGGIIYSQKIKEVENTRDYETWQKNYFFIKDGKILAEEEITITCFSLKVSNQIFNQVGFEFQNTDDFYHFAVYKNVS